MNSKVELGADEFFEQWLEHCSNDDQRAINDFVFYRYFWISWTKFLTTGGDKENPKWVHWTDADPPLINSYLASGIESRANGDTKISVITERRYWRLLERVYDYAVERGLVAENPAAGIADKEKPPSEDPKGAILSPVVRGLLHLRQHLPDGPRLELAREASRNDDEPLRPVLQRLA